MKKLIYLLPLVLIAITFWGCKKESYVAQFDKLPQERMADQIKLVQTTLTGAENGWIGILPTLSGGGYGFYMQFDNEGFVNMYADLTQQTAAENKKSEFRIRQDMGAALTFGTYTYISILNNPDKGAFGSPDVGDGFKSDIDFIYDHSTEDSIVFIGKRYRQSFSLVKATASQKQKYMQGDYETAIDKFKQFFVDNPNLYYEDGDLKVAVEANTTNSMSAGKRITFTALYPNGSIVTETQKFAFTIDQMAILNGGLVFNEDTFSRIQWKDDNTLTLFDKAGNEKVLKNNPAPLLPLYMLWGTKYSGMLSDYMQIYPGTSDKGAEMLNFYYNNLSGYLRYDFDKGSLKFVWDIVNHRLSLEGVHFQTWNNNASWTTTVTYDYTMDADGVYTFTERDGFSGGYVSEIMDPLNDFILNNKIKFDYYVDNGNVYGSVMSVEDPSIVMTFVLQ